MVSSQITEVPGRERRRARTYGNYRTAMAFLWRWRGADVNDGVKGRFMHRVMMVEMAATNFFFEIPEQAGIQHQNRYETLDPRLRRDFEGSGLVR
jgi:hypothetical protein